MIPVITKDTKLPIPSKRKQPLWKRMERYVFAGLIVGILLGGMLIVNNKVDRAISRINDYIYEDRVFIDREIE